jgi:ubiquinone/menaquinone biosynthesis C-methylase UbiE
VVGIDLSRESLLAARRRASQVRALAPVEWIHGAGEHLPLANGSVESAVVLGNIVSFAAADGPVLLRELARTVRPRGVLVADFSSITGAIQAAFHRAAEVRGFLSRFLRRPRYHLVDRILDTGFQPYAPARLAPWEVKFYTVPEATRALTRAGFHVIDAMAVAPVAAFQDRVLAVARRDERSWNGLLRIEERCGRRPGAYDVGHGFLMAATRK